MSKQLSERETAVLRVLKDAADNPADPGRPVTGDYLARALDAHPHPAHLHTSPQGAHRTAAALTRKYLAVRAGAPPVRYRITQLGRDALAGKAGTWRAWAGAR